MPILKRELDLFPNELFVIPEADLPWWVAHVRSRQEKSLARYLKHFQIPFYLPQREQRVRRRGRTFLSYLPLFSGYVFFRGTREHRVEAMRSELLVRVLEVQDQHLMTCELEQLRKLQEAGVPLVAHPYIAVGDKVRVADGPFKGYMGVVTREKGRLRLVVSVTTLKSSVSVELDREELEPVPRTT
jgi:transcription antitermination factor NusG